MVVDPQTIDEWLQKPLEQQKFIDTVDSMTVQVQCELIPGDFRDILKQYSKYKDRKLFREILLENLGGLLSWKDIVHITQNSMQHYDELVNKIETGK